MDLRVDMTSDWRAAYGEMVAYAGGKGWMDADGRVRAHVESA